MANDIFLSEYVNAFAVFQPYRYGSETLGSGDPWLFNVQSCEKTSGIEKPLRKLAWQCGNLHKRVVELREKLDLAKINLDKNPHSMECCETEAACLREFNEAIIEEELFLKQKSKIDWLRAKDCNSKYFHSVVKARTHRTHIQSIVDTAGVRIEGAVVAECFVDHYKKFLGDSQPVSMVSDVVFNNTISIDVATEMIRDVTPMEVKDAIFNIGSDKLPGPDGYNAEFFKSSWDVIGGDVTRAVLDFFHNGKLLKEINHTVITLLPKVKTPSLVTDFCPILCCNVIYKCISKIITNRIKFSLDEVINSNQSAFIPGRRISDNILLTQELMKDYHTDRGVARCAFKLDIQKAYDTVDWSFLEHILGQFGKRGLRQGDPMSPYLFTLVMEFLTLILQKHMSSVDRFRFHPKWRVQLVISVITLMQLYWQSVFILPQATIKEIEALMRGELISDRFIAQIGDGSSTFAWYDIWSDVGYLANFISYRDIHLAGFSGKTKHMVMPTLCNSSDIIKWRNYEGDLQEFSVDAVWNSIRIRHNPVDWYHIVWFGNCIPRHSFMVWLLMGEKLKTQDKLQAWETRFISSSPLQCSLCSQIIDSHEHLFFNCSFSAQLWSYCASLSKVGIGGSSWKDVVSSLQPVAKSKSCDVIIAKLLFGASVYYIWQERNRILFNKSSLPCDKVEKLIYSTVRLKIMAIKWRNTDNVQMMKADWKVP
ncbi:uncharacterized protein [Rutidosis leptorrhynchoides]|uniref:uncharacterized protein n=1 Tax=Rutidosis leptorrhynchoides TaxID=125765 RepID=UPI003A9A4CD6